jgi:hypothetical protein
LLRYRATWSFIVAKFMTDPIWWFFLIWLPDFFNKSYGLNIKKSWVHIIIIYSIVTVLSIFGGWITGRLVKGGWSVTRARETGMVIFAACVVPMFFATSLGVWPAVFLIALAGSAHQAWSANLYTTVSDLSPNTWWLRWWASAASRVPWAACCSRSIAAACSTSTKRWATRRVHTRRFCTCWPLRTWAPSSSIISSPPL